MLFNMYLTSRISQSLTFRDVLLLLGVMQEILQVASTKSGASCNVIQAKPFKEKKFSDPAMKTFCVATQGECFAKCINTAGCQSFGVGEVNECVGSLQCLLYSQVVQDKDYLQNKKKYAYYILQAPSCCATPCLNGKLCHPESCSCECPEGYTSTHCLCARNNISRSFGRDAVVVQGVVTQVESGGGITLGRNADNSVSTLVNDEWQLSYSDAKFKHISSGRAGIWGVNLTNDVLTRKGLTNENRIGTSWEYIAGQKLVQIDAGSSGVVFGVSEANEIYCRAGITQGSPFGNHWMKVNGTAKYISCGDYGCWVLKPDNSVSLIAGVTVDNCAGSSRVNVPDEFVQLDSGVTGSVYAISTNHSLYRNGGVCAKLPQGNQSWKKVLSGPFKHVTVGDTHLYVVAENGTVFKFS